MSSNARFYTTFINNCNPALLRTRWTAEKGKEGGKLLPLPQGTTGASFANEALGSRRGLHGGQTLPAQEWDLLGGHLGRGQRQEGLQVGKMGLVINCLLNSTLLGVLF